MNARSILPLALGILLSSSLLGAPAPKPAISTPPAAEILALLKKDHPRLIASAADFARLKEQTATDPLLKDWHERLVRQGARILDQPPSQYEIPDGLRLLATSRRVVQRIQTLALLYLLDGDKRYVDRAWLELKTAAAFKDWNPRHFLDTAEMTHAFALAYDWLYDQWTPEHRTILRQAMVEKAIKLANNIQSEHRWWATARHNWNQVCNGGIGLGALAIGDEEPAVAGTFLAAALQSIQLPMAEFAPDGAWAEGPGYWNYATSYNVLFLAALETALGTDFGLSQMPGFSETGMFPIYVSGPSGGTFNYADAGEGTIRAPQMFWLARKFDRPMYAWFERQHASPQPLDLVWFDARGDQPTPAALPLDNYFRNAEVATFRSAWDDRQGVFVGFKAGDNKVNHSHLDLGSFVLEALGTRWAIDLGSDDYNMPAYFGKQRWTYYRLRAEGHNTLVIDPGTEADQDPKAAARITRFESRRQRAFAIADLTPAYASHARQVSRGIALLDRREVLVEDEIQTGQPAEVWWFLHTRSQPEVNAEGDIVTLSQGAGRLQAHILSPPGAKFTVRDAQPLPTSPNSAVQNKNRGVRKLALHLSGVTDARIAVLLTPLRQDEAAPSTMPAVVPLGDW